MPFLLSSSRCSQFRKPLLLGGSQAFRCLDTLSLPFRPRPTIRSVNDSGSTSNRHVGQVVFRASQGEMQFSWNICIPGHGKARIDDTLFLSKGSWEKMYSAEPFAGSGGSKRSSGMNTSRQIGQPSNSSSSLPLRSFSYRAMCSSETTSRREVMISARTGSSSASEGWWRWAINMWSRTESGERFLNRFERFGPPKSLSRILD